MGNFGIQELLFSVYAIIPLLVCTIALVSLITSKDMSDLNKLVWAVIIIFVPVVGAILYFVFRKKSSRLSSGTVTFSTPEKT
jgi:cytochrome bd-type quinol oxidase subunit 2